MFKHYHEGPKHLSEYPSSTGDMYTNVEVKLNIRIVGVYSTRIIYDPNISCIHHLYPHNPMLGDVVVVFESNVRMLV